VLGANPDNIVVIGYVLEGQAARGHINVKVVSSFHGGLGRDASRPTEPITTKVLICHGANDPYQKKKLPLSSKKCATQMRLANDLLR
jgi:dienelactone hydrolase